MTSSITTADPHAAAEAGGDPNPHGDDSLRHGEHAAIMKLVAHAEATHVAVADGSWFDPATWADGVVPGDDARVLIPNGVAVTYDGASDARLFTVRVDGTLEFSTETSSRMVVDTLVVDPGGTLIAGTADAPIPPDVTVEIVIANDGAIDVAWDTDLISRGIISHGTTIMRGGEKTVDLKVATDPMAGDDTLILSEAPGGWKVGDKIVLTGTRYDGYKWGKREDGTDGKVHHAPEDEVRIVTAIDGNVVTLDRPLEHDHDTPRDDLKASVANYSRNIAIRTEDPDSAEIHERGHVMFMHSSDVDVRYVAFDELGRTDKSEPARNASEFETLVPDSNVKGRYSLHVHKTGVDDVEDPAVLVGNAVWGSPGWGVVHHDSHALIHDNATYDTFGAGFVAETGNETGLWSDNIAIFAQGVSWGSPKNVNDAKSLDNGRAGSGFYFEGRMIEVYDNVAASTNSGFTYFHRGRAEDPEAGLDGIIKIDPDSFEMADALRHGGMANVNDLPIRNFDGNETMASNYGFFVEKANPNQEHDVRSVISDHTAWEVRTGIHAAYTAHYLFEGIDLVGKAPTRYSPPKNGVEFGNNTSDMSLVHARIDGFETGVKVIGKFTSGHPPETRQAVGTGIEITNTGTPYDVADGTYSEVAGLDGDSPLRVVLGAPLTYGVDGGRDVVLTGVKHDSLGSIELPAGTDSLGASFFDVIEILERDGYRVAEDGSHWFLLEDYYTDRGTGEIIKMVHAVWIDPDRAEILGNKHHFHKDAVFAGEMRFDNEGPVAGDDRAEVAPGGAVVIDVLANDRDPDSNAIRVDGFVDAARGRVIDNRDGTVTYRPDPGFEGEDSFVYWVQDDDGGVDRGTVTVTVSAAPEPAPIGEAGSLRVLQPDADTWHRVEFAEAIADAVVVMGPVGPEGGQPALTRVRDVTDTGFEFQVDEWDYLDGFHVEALVSWVALSEGAHVMANGARIVAGRSDVGTEMERVAFGGPLDRAVVVAQVSSDRDAAAVTTRIDDVGAGGFDVTLEEEEAADGLHAIEEVSWIAFEAGSGDGLDVRRTAAEVGDRTDHFEFAADFGSMPVLLADMQTRRGSDSAAVRLGSLDAEGVGLRIEEERSRDRETTHIDEVVGFVAIDEGLIFA